MSDALQLLGRLHPLAVHLPIGILVLLALVEAAGLFPRAPRLAPAQRTFILVLAALTAIGTAAFGWLLAREGAGDYDAALLQRHEQIGYLTVGLAVAMVIVHLLGWKRIYAPLLVATVVALSVAGHFGGSLTHGEDYLALSAAPAAKVDVPADPAKALVFDHLVQPVLQQRCASCHGESKSKGELRLDAWEQLLKGGKSGPAFVAGDASKSLLIERLHLPLEAKEHMPPKGKPQLTEEEVALLEWWIDAGARTDLTVAASEPPPDVADMLAARFAPQEPAAAAPDRASVLATAEEIAQRLGIIVSPLAADAPWIAVNARLRRADFGDAQLAELAPIAGVIHRLDLGETAVTDDGLRSLAGMKELRRLHLDRTTIGDAALSHLASLRRLEYLNVFGTRVTDAGLPALASLADLKTLYAWQTGITPQGLKAFANRRVDRRKVERWQQEIAALQRKIEAERFRANLGEMDASEVRRVPVPLEQPPTVAAAPVEDGKSGGDDTKPVNTACPVSGKDVNAAFTEVFEGKVVAFCCADCRAKFRAEPAKFAAKLK